MSTWDAGTQMTPANPWMTSSVMAFHSPAEEAPPFAEPPSAFAGPQDGFADLGGCDFSQGFAQGLEDDPFGHHATAEDEPANAPAENFLSAARRSARAAS